MPNSYFQFKQFRVNQDKSSMKVCTDSCLFGAWVASKMANKVPGPESILDMGSGTGLLSLMVAQKTHGKIDAVEIDPDAFVQTGENFLGSPWVDRLHNYHADIRNWHKEYSYDFILSNPPFFENDLRSKEARKNFAKHHDGLTFKELLQSVKMNLSPGGNFALLLPFHRLEHCRKLAAEMDFCSTEELWIKQSFRHPYFRAIVLFGPPYRATICSELVIKGQDGDYTPSCKTLIEDYYLSRPGLSPEREF